MTERTHKLIRRIIRATLAAVLVLEMSNPLAAAERLNDAWMLQCEAAGKYCELLGEL